MTTHTSLISPPPNPGKNSQHIWSITVCCDISDMRRRRQPSLFRVTLPTYLLIADTAGRGIKLPCPLNHLMQLPLQGIQMVQAFPWLRLLQAEMLVVICVSITSDIVGLLNGVLKVLHGIEFKQARY